VPHFSKATLKLKQDLSALKEYRATAYVNIRTQWNDNTSRYDPMTEQQKATCEDLYMQMVRAGAEIGITLAERTGAQDVREFPKVAYIPLFTNAPRDMQQRYAPSQQMQSYAPAKKDELEDDIGW